MITASEVLETNRMVEQENLDVRTITMGISLLDCADASLDVTCEKIYKKITTFAKDLVHTGEEILPRDWHPYRPQARQRHAGVACRSQLPPYSR